MVPKIFFLLIICSLLVINFKKSLIFLATYLFENLNQIKQCPTATKLEVFEPQAIDLTDFLRKFLRQKTSYASLSLHHSL